MLSVVHLIEGLRNVPVLSLLSYTLYSMALHAYHVPLAVLVAWWMSPHTALTPVNEEVSIEWTMPTAVRTVVVGLVLVGAMGAQSVALSLSNHEELLAVSPGDVVLRDALDEIDGAVYTENMHWGYVWNAPVGVAMTSIPTLGLVHIDSSQQAAATQAMFYDNVSYFTEHNMLHALTSPMGTMQWTLATSPYWGVEAESDGATLWRLRPDGDAQQHLLAGIEEEDCSSCITRLDPWRDHKFRDPLGLGEDRPFLPEGTEGNLSVVAPEGAVKMCLTYEVIGATGGCFCVALKDWSDPITAFVPMLVTIRHVSVWTTPRGSPRCSLSGTEMNRTAG